MVNDRMKTELVRKGWTREWRRSTPKVVIFSKALPDKSGLITIQTTTGRGSWTSIIVLDDRRKLLKWQLWLHKWLD